MWAWPSTGAGSNEQALDQARFTDYPEVLRNIAFTRSHDVLIHRHSVTVARLRDR